MKKLHQQCHLRPSDRGLLAWDVLKLVELSQDFDVFEKSITEIGELKEAYWFGDGHAAICEEIAQHAKQNL